MLTKNETKKKGKTNIEEFVELSNTPVTVHFRTSSKPVIVEKGE